MELKVGIIGCGIIGQRRAEIINSSKNSKVLEVADVNYEKAKKLGTSINCDYNDDWVKVLENENLDAVVVSTTNNNLAKISFEAAKRGKHVLCEKPLGINVNEVQIAVDEAVKNNVIFKAGLTLRFHPGILKIKSIVDENLIGNILFIRCRYGITGRPGYEKEWRADPNLSGGGELIDQGIHVLDLFRWFLKDFSDLQGTIGTLFWDTKLEDNAIAILTTPKNQWATMHVSWTQWNNIFSFEVFGEKGYALMEGLGGAYGDEKVTFGLKAPPDKWPPEEEIMFFNHPEIAWVNEWDNFVNAIKTKSEPCGSGRDGLEALKLVFEIYEKSKRG